MTITLTREEAQQVLDALDEYRDSTEDFRVANRCISLIELLRARLSAPEPEPYGYIARRNWKMPVFIEADNVEAAGLPYNNADYEPVFKAPPQQEKQEPVAWMNESDIGRTDWKVWAHGKPTATIPLYTAPPQRNFKFSTIEEAKQPIQVIELQNREWQGLTDDEIKEIVGPWGSLPVDGYTRKLFDQIEAKLKEKNHG